MALAEGAVRAGAAGSSGSNRSSSIPMSSLLLATEDAEQEEAEALTILRPESTYNYSQTGEK